MKKFAGYFLNLVLILLLVACNTKDKIDDSSEPTNKIKSAEVGMKNSDEAKNYTINWDIINYDINEQHPYSDVYVTIKGEKQEKVFIGTFQAFFIISEEELTKDSILSAQTWWGGAGDELYIYPKDEETLSVMHRVIDSQSEIPPFEEIKEIKIGKKSIFKKIETVFSDGESEFYVKYNPFVYDSILLGGSFGAEWIDAKTVAPLIKGTERYMIYKMDGFFGEATGGIPISKYNIDSYLEEIEIKPNPEVKIDSKEFLAVNSSIPLDVPRNPMKQNNDNEDYIKIIKSILKDNGLENSEANVIQNYKIDLDDDGVDEVLIYATNVGDNEFYQKNQYSILVLRKVIDGKVENIFLEKIFVTTNINELDADIVKKFDIKQFADLNHDNNMDIIIGFRYFDGYGYNVYEVKSNKVEKVLSNG